MDGDITIDVPQSFCFLCASVRMIIAFSSKSEAHAVKL